MKRSEEVSVFFSFMGDTLHRENETEVMGLNNQTKKRDPHRERAGGWGLISISHVKTCCLLFQQKISFEKVLTGRIAEGRGGFTCWPTLSHYKQQVQCILQEEGGSVAIDLTLNSANVYGCTTWY